LAFRRPRRGNISLMKKIISLTTCFFILLIPISVAFAQVPTRVRVIEASNVGSSIDPSLKDVQSDLKSFSNFTSYRLLKDENLSLSPNRPADIPIHKGRSLEITLVGQRKDMAECRVKIKSEGTDILNTQVRLSSGRTVLIIGPKHGEGVAIIALSARF
jgi:hypothetical protein